MRTIRKLFLRKRRRTAPRTGTISAHKKYVAYKEPARILVHARLAYFSTLYEVSYNRVFIKNQKSRWGSCSKSGNLNFNYRILFLSPEQQDYIIVHELCHLKEFNHSARFWALVAEQIPHYAEIRASLRKIKM